MRRSARSLAVVLCLLPAFALAAGGLPAGFAPASIFASQTDVVAGDTISLFTALYNSSATELQGDVVFTVDGATVGTKHVSLNAGDAQTVSVPWTASQGTHQASARLDNATDQSGTQESLLNAQADAVTITVAAAPPPSAAQQTASQAVALAQTGAAQVAPVAQQIFNSVEQVRQDVVQTIADALASSTPDQGRVLGTSTSALAASAAMPGTGSDWFGTVWRAVLSALLFVCRVQVLFYAAVCIVIYILYKLFAAMLGERRHRFG